MSRNFQVPTLTDKLTQTLPSKKWNSTTPPTKTTQMKVAMMSTIKTKTAGQGLQVMFQLANFSTVPQNDLIGQKHKLS